MIPTAEEIKMAHGLITGRLDEDELREALSHQDPQAIIEALKLELRETRRERDQHAQDLQDANAAITLRDREIAALKGRVTELKNKLAIAEEALRLERRKVREIVGGVG